MSENNQEIQTQYLGIHYYFDDDSHSMNAFIRNQMEKNYLDIIAEIARILDAEVKIESQAREEGGIIDFLLVNIDIKDAVVASIALLAPAINKIIIHYLTGKHKKDKLDNELKKLQIETYKIKNEAEKQKLQELSIALDENIKIRRLLSNLYKKAKQYNKITKIGYIDYQNSQVTEEVVSRNNFSNFILDTNNDTVIDDEASIEIISPVLKKDTFKWKGIYKGENIDFSMGDDDFKKSVIEKKYNFENGSTIISRLEIKNTYDEFGEKTKKTSYRVAEVYEIIKKDITLKTNAGHKKDKRIAKSQERSLFEFGDDNATE